MKFLRHNSMHEAIVVASGLFVGSIISFFISTQLPNVAYLNLIVLLLSFLAMLLVPIVLISTWFSNILSDKDHSNDSCGH